MNEVKMRSSNSNNFVKINNSASKVPMTTIDSIKMKLLIDSQHDNELHELKRVNNGIQKIKLHIKNDPLENDSRYDQEKEKNLKKRKVDKIPEIKENYSSRGMNKTVGDTFKKNLRFKSQSKSNNSRTKNSGPTIYTNQTFARTRSSFGISVDQPILLDSSSDSENNDPNRFFGKKRRLSGDDNGYDKAEIIKNLGNGKSSKEQKIRISNRSNSKLAESKSSSITQKSKGNISNKHNNRSINKEVLKQSSGTQLKKVDLSKQASSTKSTKKRSKPCDEENLPIELKHNYGKAINMGLKKNDPKAKCHNKNYEKGTQKIGNNRHSTEKEDEDKPISKKNLNESLQDLGKIPRKSKADSENLASLPPPILDSTAENSNGLTRKSKNRSTRSQSIKVDIKIEQNEKIANILQNLDDDKKETINEASGSLSNHVPPFRNLKNSFSACISCSKSKGEDFCNRKKPCDICVGKKLKHCTYPLVKNVQQSANNAGLRLSGKKDIGFELKKEAKTGKKFKVSKYLPSTTGLSSQSTYSKNEEIVVSEADDESKSESAFDSESDTETSGAESEIKVFARTRKSDLKHISSFPNIYKSDGEDNEDFPDNDGEDVQSDGNDDSDDFNVVVDDDDKDYDEYDDRKLSEKLAKREGSLKAQRVLQELEFDSRDLTGMFNRSRSRRNATKENYYVPSDEEDENSSAIAYEEAAARNECLILSEDEQERRMLRGNISKDFLESVRQERDKHMLHHNAHDSVSSDSDYE